MDEYKEAARDLSQRNAHAAKVVEAALVEYGASRHALVDVLLDVRNALRRS